MEHTEPSRTTDHPIGKCRERAERLATLPQADALIEMETETLGLMFNINDAFTVWAKNMFDEKHKALGWSQVILQAARVQAQLTGLAVDLRAKREELAAPVGTD